MRVTTVVVVDEFRECRRRGAGRNGTEIDELPFDLGLRQYGKQGRDIPGCISYLIAANGAWELLPVGRSVPDSFDIDLTGTTLQWTNPANTALTLVAVLDEAQAVAGQASAARFQAAEPGSLQSLNLSAVAGLTPGTRYVVTEAAVDAQRRRLAAGSIVVVR